MMFGSWLSLTGSFMGGWLIPFFCGVLVGPVIVQLVMRGNFFERYSLDHWMLHVTESSGSMLMNFGLWPPAASTDQFPFRAACLELVRAIGRNAQLRRGAAILDVGFGCGDQFAVWTEEFGVGRVTGFNTSASQTEFARRHRVGPDRRIEVYESDVFQHRFQPSSLDAIVAVDSLYHVKTRRRFFALAYRLLRPGGRLSASDLLLMPTFASEQSFVVARLVAWAAGVPWANRAWERSGSDCVNPLDVYLADLLAAGFRNASVEDVTDRVLRPFSDWVLEHTASPVVAAKVGGAGRLRPFRLVGRAMQWLLKRHYVKYVLIHCEK